MVKSADSRVKPPGFKHQVFGLLPSHLTSLCLRLLTHKMGIVTASTWQGSYDYFMSRYRTEHGFPADVRRPVHVNQSLLCPQRP